MCSVRQEVPRQSDSKHIQVIGTSSGKWNRGCPRVSARPFVSGVESKAAIREGRWREISGEGERESDWETSCDAQWKFWSLIGHLIYWSYQGDWASDYLRDYLVPVCSAPSLSFFFVFLSLSPAVLASLFQCHSLFLCLPLSHPRFHFAGSFFLSSLHAVVHKCTLNYLTMRLDKAFMAFC